MQWLLKITTVGTRSLLAGLLSVAFTGSLVACVGEPAVMPEPRPGVQSGPRFELSLEPGPQYSKDMRIMWYRYTVWPQVAVWLEKPDGTFISTIYVTERVVTGDYTAAPKQGRPEALPVWSHLENDDVDAVSSPTTVGSTVKYGNNLAEHLPAGIYVVKLETNRSYDWNAVYTKKKSGVNGQPSVLYRAELEIGDARTEAVFQPFGTGSINGGDGATLIGLKGIDTALELFSDMRISFEAY